MLICFLLRSLGAKWIFVSKNAKGNIKIPKAEKSECTSVNCNRIYQHTEGKWREERKKKLIIEMRSAFELHDSVGSEDKE